jgi:hypothetical protein
VSFGRRRGIPQKTNNQILTIFIYKAMTEPQKQKEKSEEPPADKKPEESSEKAEEREGSA